MAKSIFELHESPVKRLFASSLYSLLISTLISVCHLSLLQNIRNHAHYTSTYFLATTLFTFLNLLNKGVHYSGISPYFLLANVCLIGSSMLSVNQHNCIRLSVNLLDTSLMTFNVAWTSAFAFQSCHFVLPQVARFIFPWLVSSWQSSGKVEKLSCVF